MGSADAPPTELANTQSQEPCKLPTRLVLMAVMFGFVFGMAGLVCMYTSNINTGGTELRQLNETDATESKSTFPNYAISTANITTICD